MHPTRSFQLLATCALLGCGSAENVPTNADKQPTPAPTSTPPPTPTDLKPARLSLRYVDREGPVANVTVVFHDVEGAVLETTVTNASGVALSRQGVATQATVVSPVASRPSFLTYTGLEAGDEIVIAPPITGAGFVQGTLPAFAGATRYHLDANGCSGERLNTAGTHAVALDGCDKDAFYILLGVARNDSNFPLAYAYHSGIAPDGRADLAWAPPSETTVNIQNGSPRTTTSFWHVFNGRRVGTSGGGDSASPVLLRTAAPATELDIELFDRTKVANMETERILVVRAPAQQAISVDFSAALPAPTSLGAQLKAEQRPALSWTWPAPVVAATGGAVSANWMKKTADGQKSVGVWTFVVPPSATGVVAPSLPADIPAAVPSGEPNLLTLEFSSSVAPTDYRSFRSHYRDGAAAQPARSITRTTKE